MSDYNAIGTVVPRLLGCGGGGGGGDEARIARFPVDTVTALQSFNTGFGLPAGTALVLQLHDRMGNQTFPDTLAVDLGIVDQINLDITSLLIGLGGDLNNQAGAHTWTLVAVG